MLEFRLWNRALSAAELAEYGQKSLTGYEHGLLCYYGLNEGEGLYSYDCAGSGIDLGLIGVNWKRPQGLAMRLDGTGGIRLQPDRFARTDAQDYTLMFWFNTSDRQATLLANGEAQTEADARNHINVGVKEGRLFVRSGDREFNTDASCNDGQWHHFAMTVSRSRNVGNIYMDKKLVESFSVDSLGGIMGNKLALGATYADDNTCKEMMNGYIDEVAMFSSVLPVNMLQDYVNKAPTGTEAALLAYLDFGRSELQDDNTQRLEPTGISLKRYKDARGNVVARRDTLVEQSVINAHASRDVYAPMTSTNKLDNVNFSYVANGNQLMLNLDVPDYQIEKNNIYVTVKEVPDLNGNYMASPLTMDFYVYRNPLRWNIKHTNLQTDYGKELTFEATIRNLSVYVAQDGYGKDKKFGGAAIVGTVKDGITLVNCTAGGYLGSRENPCGHNAAGVIAYVCTPTVTADAGTFAHCVHLVNVTNNVNVFATRKVGGIIAFLVHDIILENVVNNGNVVRVTGSSRSDDGVGGIVGFAHYTTLSTYHLNGVANTGHVEVSADAADGTKGSCGQLFGCFCASQSGGSFNTGDIRLRFDKAALPLTRDTNYFSYLKGLRFKFGVMGADGLCHVVPELVDGGTYVYLIGKATDCALNLPAGAKVTIDQRFGVPTFQVGAGLDVHGEQEDGTDLWTYTVTAAS